MATSCHSVENRVLSTLPMGLAVHRENISCLSLSKLDFQSFQFFLFCISITRTQSRNWLTLSTSFLELIQF